MPADPEHHARRKRATALASGLVSPADVEAAEQAAGERLAGGAVDGQQLDDATIAVLVEQGKLTPFQAREIAAGRSRFRLGQYTVIDEIGRGGMGQVFKAEHALMGRVVAVKVLPRSKANPESEAAFRREMRILGRLDHENLVRAFDAGYDAMVYYLVTEFVAGLDLRRHVRSFGPLDETGAASVFVQVARGLAFAHEQSLVHRDVKPGNILVTDDGRAKLLDLGLAGSTIEEEAQRLGRVVGTMDYIAPEQIRSPDDVGPPADIYGLGCTLYYALTGQVPFPGGTRKEKMQRHLAEPPVPIRHLAPQVSPAFCRVVEAMMEKSVAQRLGSATEVVDRLARWAPERPLSLPRQRVDRRLKSRSGDVADSWTNVSGGDSSAPEVLDPAAVVLRDPPHVPQDRAHWPDRVADSVEAVVELLSDPRAALTVLGWASLAGAAGGTSFAIMRSMEPAMARGLPGMLTPASCGFAAFLIVTWVQVSKRLDSRSRRTRRTR